jgi:adenylate cyclase
LPRDPRLFLGYLGIGWARLLLGDDEGAIEMLRTAVSLSPSYSPAYLGLAAAYGLLDRLDEARSVSAAYLRTGTPTNTIALVRARETSTHPAFMAQHERLFAGLRKAGLPEE